MPGSIWPNNSADRDLHSPEMEFWEQASLGMAEQQPRAWEVTYITVLVKGVSVKEITSPTSFLGQFFWL